MTILWKQEIIVRHERISLRNYDPLCTVGARAHPSRRGGSCYIVFTDHNTTGSVPVCQCAKEREREGEKRLCAPHIHEWRPTRPLLQLHQYWDSATDETRNVQKETSPSSHFSALILIFAEPAKRVKFCTQRCVVHGNFPVDLVTTSSFGARRKRPSCVWVYATS